MSISRLVPTRISNNQSYLLIAFNPGSEFNCSRCKETVRELVCFCHECNRYMHPSCAGVERETVYGTDGRERVVLPVSEKLPKSCYDCLRKKETVRTNPLYLWQRSKLAANQQNSTTCDVKRYTSPPALGNNSSHHICPINNSPSVLAPYSSSITSGLELGKSHKVEEGHGDCMVHRHNPGHDLCLNDNGKNYICHGCKMDGIGLHYACGNDLCPFLLHRECFSPRKTTTHSFFPQSTFLFMCLPSTSYSKLGKKEHTNVFCDACGMNVKGYYYHDRNGLYNLHPCCVNLESQIICGDTGAKMVLQKESTSKCGYCLERRVKRGKSSTDHVWSYVANNENVHLHIGCILKMLSDWGEDSMTRLLSCNMISTNGSARMKWEIALQQATNTCETKFKILVKYLKIALGAVISAFMGDPTTLFFNTAMVLSSN